MKKLIACVLLLSMIFLLIAEVTVFRVIGWENGQLFMLRFYRFQYLGSCSNIA